jgi:plastocyanin
MRIASLVVFLAACDTSGGEPAVVDAAPDVPAIPVVALDSCPPTVAATVMDSATKFIPKDSTITIGNVVKFVITAEHFVMPNTLTTTDPALMVRRGETKCFRFNVPGTYNFLCGAHSFPGSIIVQ